MLGTNEGPDGASECSYSPNPDSPVCAIASTVRRRRFARSDRRQRSHRRARQPDDCVRVALRSPRCGAGATASPSRAIVRSTDAGRTKRSSASTAARSGKGPVAVDEVVLLDGAL